MKSIAAFIFISFFQLTAVQAQSIRDFGNGGGGLDDGGQVMTWYTSLATSTKRALSRDEIPGLSFLIQHYENLRLLPEMHTRLMVMSLPTDSRKYYKVEEGEISQQDYQAMVLNYAKLMNLPPEKVVIFAFTNSDTGITLLLPEFFKLKTEAQQAAILFHESLWMAPSDWNLNYHSVISAELSAQAYFEHPENPDNYSGFYKTLSSLSKQWSLPLRAFLDFDQNQGLPWSVSKNSSRILLKNLLSEKILNCYFRDHVSVLRNSPDLIFSSVPELEVASWCRDIVTNEMLNLSEKYPQSLLIRGLLNYANNNALSFDLFTFNPRGPYEVVDYKTKYGEDLKDKDYQSYIDQLYMSVITSDDSINYKFDLQNEDGSPAGLIQF